MKKNSVLLICLVLITTVFFSACSGSSADSSTNSNSSESNESTDNNENDNSSSSNSDGETFTIGLEAAYPPFNWTQLDDSNGAVKIDGTNQYAGGYDVEIAKRIAQSLGKELVIKKIEWGGLVPAVQSGVIDGIIAGMSPSEERKQSIDFSEKYYESSYVLVVRKDSKYASSTKLNDLSGAKITAQLGTVHYNLIEQIDGVNKIPAQTDFPTMRVALDSGAIDAYVTEIPEAKSSCFANENFVYLELTDGFEYELSDTAIAVGFKKGYGETEKINAAINAISNEDRDSIMNEAIKNQPIMN